MIKPSEFVANRWLAGPHRQTLWGSILHRRPPVILTRERLELPDGDFIDLDWHGPDSHTLVVILHGLEGSSRSHYAQGLLKATADRGWQGVVAHFRSCSGEPNRHPKSYHAAHTDDIDFVIHRYLHNHSRIAIVGYSLGGSVLLNWLAQRRQPIQAAVAVSVPFQLDLTAQRLRRGSSRIYQTYLLQQMKKNYRNKLKAGLTLPLSNRELRQIRDFYAFDDRITAPLNGFRNVADYYYQASCRQRLKAITNDTLIIQAADDPFMMPDALPGAEQLSPSTLLEVSGQGGHVGFIGGRHPRQREYWLERRIPEFLEPCLQ